MVAMVKLAPCCELGFPPPCIPREGGCSTLFTVSPHIPLLPLHLPFHPSVSLHAGYRFSLPSFCHPFIFPASSSPSLPHLSFTPKWPPHGLQTGPERCAERGDLQRIIAG